MAPAPPAPSSPNGARAAKDATEAGAQARRPSPETVTAKHVEAELNRLEAELK